MPTVSKTFCRILDGAPAWARAWAALTARRSTHLEFATCKPWNYPEGRPYTKAELRALRKEMMEAHGDACGYMITLTSMPPGKQGRRSCMRAKEAETRGK